MARSLELDRKSRNELVEEARGLGVDRPERMTRVELVDEIIRRTTPAAEQAEARGLFGVARSMLASVVESGLNLPEAASVIRGGATPSVPTGSQAPVATVTLAEIYAAQGHKGRALRMVEEVLRTEPDHQEALRVLRELGQPEAAFKQPSDSSSLAPAPDPSAPTSDYAPAAFAVDTTGEEIRTGDPPLAEAVPSPMAPAVDELASNQRHNPDSRSFEREASTQIEQAPVAEIPVAESVESEPLPESEPEPEIDYDPEDIPESQRLTAVPGVTMEPDSASLDAVPLISDDEEPSGVMEKPSSLEPGAPSADDEDEVPPVESQSVPASGHLKTGSAPALILSQQGPITRAYWELPERVLDQCGVDRSEGAACVKMVSIIPHGAHPERREETYYLRDGKQFGPDLGQIDLPTASGVAAVRAALGWVSGDLFLPICVAKNLSELASDDSAQALLSRLRLHRSD